MTKQVLNSPMFFSFFFKYGQLFVLEVWLLYTFWVPGARK
jgi:hypothetical protein